MAKALITGITGMVGSHLVDFLLENTDWDGDPHWIMFPIYLTESIKRTEFFLIMQT